MGFFSKKRKDGQYVGDREKFMIIMPYILKSRTESLVYYEFEVDITNARTHMHQMRRGGESISFFNMVVAAAVQTFAKYKRANRFIAGRRIYQRNDIEICYTMKRELTEEGDEVTVKLAFEPTDTLSKVAEKMNSYMNFKRDDSIAGTDEKFISVLKRTPRFVISAFVGFIKFMDFYGVCPRAITSDLPFWCSLFITNMGSLGLRAPIHHLYEVGTCSMFLSMGRPEKKTVVSPNGKTSNHLSISFAISIDERIVDGFYLSRVITHFQHLLLNPENIDWGADSFKKK